MAEQDSRLLRHKMRGTNNGSNPRGGRAHPPPRPANSMEQDSFDSFEEDESELMQQGMQGLRLGVPANGLGGSNGSVNSGHSGGIGGVGGGGNQLNADEDELPKSVIVTNVDLGVFDTQEGKVGEKSKQNLRLFRYVLYCTHTATKYGRVPCVLFCVVLVRGLTRSDVSKVCYDETYVCTFLVRVCWSVALLLPFREYAAVLVSPSLPTLPTF